MAWGGETCAVGGAGGFAGAFGGASTWTWVGAWLAAGAAERGGVCQGRGSGSGMCSIGRSRSTSFCIAITGDCIGGRIDGGALAFGAGFGSTEGFGAGTCLGSGARATGDEGCGRGASNTGVEGWAGAGDLGRALEGIGVLAVTGAGLALAAGRSRAFL